MAFNWKTSRSGGSRQPHSPSFGWLASQRGWLDGRAQTVTRGLSTGLSSVVHFGVVRLLTLMAQGAQRDCRKRQEVGAAIP